MVQGPITPLPFSPRSPVPGIVMPGYLGGCCGLGIKENENEEPTLTLTAGENGEKVPDPKNELSLAPKVWARDDQGTRTRILGSIGSLLEPCG